MRIHTRSSCPSHFIWTMIVLVLPLFPIAALAQDDCSKTLQEARNLYDLGMIDDIPKMLAPCMQEGFTRPQKIEAYKLLVLAYLFDDDQFDAEKTMTEFLKKYPEYEIMPNDPVEFIHLFETYRTTSEFCFGLMAGLNLTNPRIIEPFSMIDLSKGEFSDNTLSGYQFGIAGGRYITKRMMLNLELHFGQNHYSFTDKDTLTKQDGYKLDESYTFEEKLKRVSLPVTIMYEINSGKLLYFIRAGASVNYVLSVSGLPSGINNKQPIPGSVTDMKDYRNTFYFNAIAGVGMHYNIPRGFIALDIRYNYGISNIVKSEKRFENTYLYSQFKYLDDDFSLNAFSFSVGYYFSFYNPKKTK
jgi:Outer membrane protein beta-barrel domain